MYKTYKLLPILSILALFFVQGCSLKNSDQITNIEHSESINELAQQSNINLTPSNARKNRNFAHSDDSWQYLISLFSIPEVDDDLIEKQLQWYLARPNYIAIIQTRARPYLYNIIKQVEEKGLPGEIALLPAVESGFKAHAYSRAHASGLWQFIPSTGRLYGLDQNWWYDGRRDVYASTDAATSYLKKLGASFDNDWLLALASYNAGLGTVSRAVKRNASKNEATDFWSLNLPRETKNYVPKLLALAKIFAHAEQYGISLKSQSHKPAFIAVNIGSQLALSTAARLSDISQEELLHLNPGFKQGHTPPQGPHRLLIPVDNVEIFKRNLAMLPVDKRIKWHRHKIKKGESLGKIAHRYQTNIHAIREINHLSNNNIRAGASLFIPATANVLNHKPVLQMSSINTDDSPFSYTVKQGDSLWSIARKFNTQIKTLAHWNNIKLEYPLHPGQTLQIKKHSNTQHQQFSKTNKVHSIQYTVRNGDSLYAISKKYKVRIADLRKWNASQLGNFLQPGQTLTVKIDKSQPAT